MKKLFVIVVFICLKVCGIKAFELSDSLRVSIITQSPGNELYSTFGHTAIRVIDLKQGYDIAFNYGTFDFQTPNFYLRFALGQLDYLLSVEPFERFVQASQAEKRSLTEQVLDLKIDEIKTIVNLLVINYQPENRAYRYRFFTDNCATRVRDILVRSFKQPDLLAAPQIESNQSFRTLFNRYVETMPWSRFGIELVLGKMTDDTAGYDALFLPDNLQLAIKRAHLGNKPLVKDESILLQSQPMEPSTTWFTPLLVAFLVLLLAIGIQYFQTAVRTFDTIFFIAFACIGAFVLTLSMLSSHHEVRNNWVVIFIQPTLIFIPFLKKGNIKKYVVMASGACIVVALMFLWLLPQTFHPAILLLALAIAIRLFFNFAQLKKV